MPRRRLGVALLVPPPVAVEVDGLRRALGDPSRRRIPPHLTLVPPVNVREEDLGAALDVLRRAARAVAARAPRLGAAGAVHPLTPPGELAGGGGGAVPPLDLRLGPAATFHPVNPVVYLAVGGAVAALGALRERVFVPPLERTLAHPFVPHVTVADDLDPDRIRAALTALVDYVVDVRIDAVHLLEEGRDRVWRPIADAPLSRRARPV